MKLWALIWYDTDGFTYGCDQTIAICESKDIAETKLLEDNQKHPDRHIDDYRVEEFNLNEIWDD